MQYNIVTVGYRKSDYWFNSASKTLNNDMARPIMSVSIASPHVAQYRALVVTGVRRPIPILCSILYFFLQTGFTNDKLNPFKIVPAQSSLAICMPI